MADPADRDSSLAVPASRACPRGSVLISSGPRPAFSGNRNPRCRPRRFRPGRACHAVLRGPPRGGRRPRLDTRPRPKPRPKPRTSPHTSPRVRFRRHARACPRVRPPRRDMSQAAEPRTSVTLPNPRPPGPTTRTPRSARQCPTPPWTPLKDRPGKTGGATTTCPSGSARPASRSRSPLARPPRSREPADARAAPRAIRRQPRPAGPRADQEPGPPADQEAGPPADQEAGLPADQEPGRGLRTPSCSTTGCPAASAQRPAATAAAPRRSWSPLSCSWPSPCWPSRC